MPKNSSAAIIIVLRRIWFIWKHFIAIPESKFVVECIIKGDLVYYVEWRIAKAMVAELEVYAAVYVVEVLLQAFFFKQPHLINACSRFVCRIY